MAIETLVFAFDALRRRLVLLLLPLLVAIPAAIYLTSVTPLRYSAKSIIMLQAANRNGDVAGAFASRGNAAEQVNAIGAWLKSDEVLGALLPKLVDGPLPQTLQGQVGEMMRLRNALKLEVVGSTVLEVTLEGNNAKGLGRKLEIIVSRMMEGLLNPEAGILSAPQLVLLRRNEGLVEAEHELQQAIAASGIGSSDTAMRRLKEIYDLQREAIARSSTPAGGQAGREPTLRPAHFAEQIEERRRQLSPDMRLVTRLELLFTSFEEARQAFETAKRNVGSRVGDNYVRVFDAPERLAIIGRPRDPLGGRNPATRLAVAVLLLSIAMGAVLVVLAELLDPRLRTRREFESLTGVPLITRIPQLAPAELQRA